MSDPARFHLRLMFEWGGGCLWGRNAAVTQTFGVGHVEDLLPLTDETRARMEELSIFHDTALDWNDPAGPSPWTPDDVARFDRAALELLERIRAEVGPEFQVDYPAP
jgi:hypothetical protein